MVNFKEQLESMNCDELRVMAKKYNVQRYKHNKRLKKIELISLLLRREAVIEFERSRKMAREGAERKVQYLDTAELGTLVAFAYKGGAKSAKIINRSTKDKKLEVETEYGAKLTISYEDVLWIKTGTRWPKGIYNLLKGYDQEDTEK